MLASIVNEPWFILIILLIIFGAIALGVFLLRKFVLNRNKEEEKPNEKEIMEEELSNILVDIDENDEDTKKEFAKFNEDSLEDSEKPSDSEED